MSNYYFSVNFDNKFKLPVSRKTFYKYVSMFESENRQMEYNAEGRLFFLYPCEMSMKMFRRFCSYDAELTRKSK